MPKDLSSGILFFCPKSLKHDGIYPYCEIHHKCIVCGKLLTLYEKGNFNMSAASKPIAMRVAKTVAALFGLFAIVYVA